MQKSTTTDAYKSEYADFPSAEHVTNPERAASQQQEHADDSNGAVNWTKKQIIAVLSLSALWVGE